jgi:hypothetical protein
MSRSTLRAALLFAAAFGAALSGEREASAAEHLADGTVYARGVDPLVATPIQQEQAQARFSRGKEHFEAGEFQAAADEFGASFAIVASPNARLYRARCLLQLGKSVEAYAEYGRTMVQALELAKQEARYQRTADAATAERRELERELAFVRMSVHRSDPETRLFVNGEEIRRTAWGEPVPVMPGPVKVELVTPGYPTREQALELEKGSSQELVLDVGEKPPSARTEERAAPTAPRARNAEDLGEKTSLRPYAYASAGLGLVGFGAFAVLGTMSKKDFEELEATCENGVCPADEGARIERGQREQTWANVGLVVGAVGLSSAVTLWLLEPPDERGPSARIGVRLLPNGAAIRGEM